MSVFFRFFNSRRASNTRPAPMLAFQKGLSLLRESTPHRTTFSYKVADTDGSARRNRCACRVWSQGAHRIRQRADFARWPSNCPFGIFRFRTQQACAQSPCRTLAGRQATFPSGGFQSPYSPFIRIVMCQLHCLHLSHRICLTYTYCPLYPAILEYHTGYCKRFFLFFALLFLSIPQLLTMSAYFSESDNLAANFRIRQKKREKIFSKNACVSRIPNNTIKQSSSIG